MAAQEAERVLDEIVVTATKRVQDMQDVPKSIVVLDGSKIHNAALRDIEELQSYVPNLAVTDSALGPIVHIRGMGSGVNQGFEQSVGVYIDGIYHGRAQQSRMPLVDVAQVEVLRGSQSILFGKKQYRRRAQYQDGEADQHVRRRGATALYGSTIGERQLGGFFVRPYFRDLFGPADGTFSRDRRIYAEYHARFR